MTIAPGQMRSISSSLGDEFAGRPGENFDDLESAPANRHGRAKDPKFAAGKVDLALARGVNQPNFFRRRHVHGPTCGFLHLIETSANDRIIGSAQYQHNQHGPRMPADLPPQSLP